MFKTLHQLFDHVENTYNLKNPIPMITGGVGYEEYRTEFFEVSTTLKTKKKYVKVIIYRLPSGNYELTSYIC